MDVDTDGAETPRADMWGPVVTDFESLWYSRCSRQTNNTAELLGIVMALLWLWFVDETTEPAILLVDSLYA
eukprot:SAG11_NODE_38789_length_249_cov_43.226667_1_plen_70_part_01